MIIEFSLNCTGTWVDYTDNVDLNELKVMKNLSAENNPQKNSTGTLLVDGPAYTFIKTNLIDSLNKYANSICVRITDTTCGGGELYFKIDNQNIKWCDDDGCEMEMNLIGYEPELDCIKNTAISDNTNNWFDQFGPIIHPRFRYCDVLKPTLMFIFIMKIAQILDLLIAFVNNVIIGGINGALNVLGITPITPFQYLGNLLSGCQRAWPAPFIRTYIENVCNVCGLTVNNITAPIFFSPWDPLAPIAQNPYYNATLLTAYTKKGVPINGTQSYIPNNRPSWILTDFLSKMKDIWNARWFINNGQVYFHRKDKIGELIWGTTPAIDLTGADAGNVLEGVCFSWNGKGKLRRLNMNWGRDASDAIANEALSRFNGEFIEMTNNPNYTEAVEIDVPDFGACGFVLDGIDYDYDKPLGDTLGVNNIERSIKSTTDTCALARIVIYDPATPLTDAKAISTPVVNYTPFAGIYLPAFEDDNASMNYIAAINSWNMNYPMSFDPDQDTIAPPNLAAGNRNLWEYHKIDAPAPDKKTNIKFTLTLNLCCDYITLNVYQRVKMKNGDMGEITDVEFDYKRREILINGNLL